MRRNYVPDAECTPSASKGGPTVDIVDNTDDREGEKKGEGAVVCVAFPNAVPGVFDYAVPARLACSILPGTPVLVRLRSRETWGVAVAIKAESQFPELKEVLDCKTGTWTDSGSSLLRLYRWMAGYYQCELGRVFKPFMRKGLLKSSEKKILVFTAPENAPAELLNDKYRDIYDQLAAAGAVTAVQARQRLGIPRAALNYLCRKNCLKRSEQPVIREAAELSCDGTAGPTVLTGEQTAAVERVMAGHGAPARPFLLYGITGSGKTHVYIELASRTLKLGKGVIILVPEIALTPQTIRRFRNALGAVISVIHSHMSDGERRDSLQELVAGTKRVVIGVRSAVLAPMDAVGLIIVDEEHDGSYKQSDLDPRYNARDVAVMRGHFQKALVVLGSATPSLESYWNARNGKYELLRLTHRFGAAALPRVELVDMRAEKESNNWEPLSRRLADAITGTLAADRQVILLLNRRGYATVLLCKDCGFTASCPDCSVTLRYHREGTVLKCHLCGHSEPAPAVCPGCRGEKIKYKGIGIQKIEQYLRERYPQARLLRMDQDSTRRKGAHASMLGRFADREADILLGTQMVAKGLNFPGVALVGVITADTGLHIPDFRASERTFQLLTQVAGRAGRADSSGEVIIQTYSPDECALRCAALHDYETFYREECESRRMLGYPPWGRIARIVVAGKSGPDVERFARRMAGQVKSAGGTSLTLLGPSPAILERIAGESRYMILLKSPAPGAIGMALQPLRSAVRSRPAGITVAIDVDPVNML